MICKKIQYKDFRNIENAEIEFCDGVNIFYGNNAMGKTNALEGIYIFSRGKSFRAKEDKELLKFGEDGFHISIDFSTKNGEEKLEYSLFGKERQRKKNRRIRTVVQALGQLVSVS